MRCATPTSCSCRRRTWSSSAATWSWNVREDARPGVRPAQIVPASIGDVPDLLRLIRALAEYEKLLDQVIATEDGLRETLFGADPAAEALLSRASGRVVGFSVYFRNCSTFRGKPGLYLEDLFVE